VSVKGNYMVLPSTTAYGNKTYIVITAANQGRRPITLSTAFLVLPRRLRKKGLGTHAICVDPMTAKPVKLTEGESHQFMIDQECVNINTRELVAGVCDQTGGHHFSHGYLKRIWRLKTLRKHG